MRRRREKTLSGAYDVAGLGDVDSVRRVLEIALYDVLGLDNSVARDRLLLGVVTAGTKLLGVAEQASFRFEVDDEG